jgi:SPP1 gp7 family putative phage head morphogenesis protein
MQGLGVTPSWTILNENMAKQIVNADFKGANFSERIWNNKSKLREHIEKGVIDSVISGQSKDKAVREIKRSFGVGFNDADRIVRTETQRVLNDGQRQTYKDRGYSQVEWLVADDERLCNECMEIDGVIFNIDEVPAVLHPRCRCTFIPVLDEDLFK